MKLTVFSETIGRTALPGSTGILEGSRFGEKDADDIADHKRKKR